MDSYMNILIEDLRKAAATLEAVSNEGLTSFDQALILSSFFKEHQRTNNLVDYAMQVIEGKAGEEICRLKEDALTLKEKADEFCRIYLGNQAGLDAIDADNLYEDHIRPFAEREKAERDLCLPLWREYSRLSNRLDYMDRDSEEYPRDMAECDRVKAEYDIHHEDVGRLHREWHEEVNRSCHAAYLSIGNVHVLCQRLSEIAVSIVQETEILNGRSL